MQIRRMIPEDAEALSKMIRRTIAISNSKDYSKDHIEKLLAAQSPEMLLERAQQGHTYVFLLDGEIAGSGTVAPYWDNENESILLNIFVMPECQGRGIGKFILASLEHDEYGRRAERIEVPSNITGLEFFLARGYGFKGGKKKLEDNVTYRLEKYPKKKKDAGKKKDAESNQ